jgi:hypothetical protein
MQCVDVSRYYDDAKTKQNDYCKPNEEGMIKPRILRIDTN